MLNLPSYMEIFKNKSTCNNLLVMSKITQAFFVTLRNLFMVSSKLPKLGMPKWTTFLRCHSDPNVYTKKVGSHLISLFLYVDDLIVTGSVSKLLNHVKTNLKRKFQMTDLGFFHYFLGLQVLQTNEGIFLSQSKHACDLLHHFHMDDCKSTPSPFQSRVNLTATYTSPKVDSTLYRQLVRSLLYLTHTRPNISFDGCIVSRYIQTPHESNCK
jgi:hypothetical protein